MAADPPKPADACLSPTIQQLRSTPPVDPNGRVIPEQTAIVLRAVIIRHLVTDDRIRRERAKAMGKTGRNPELLPVLSRQFCRHILTKGR